jgi:hypothetical protein
MLPADQSKQDEVFIGGLPSNWKAQQVGSSGCVCSVWQHAEWGMAFDCCSKGYHGINVSKTISHAAARDHVC